MSPETIAEGELSKVDIEAVLTKSQRPDNHGKALAANALQVGSGPSSPAQPCEPLQPPQEPPPIQDERPQHCTHACCEGQVVCVRDRAGHVRWVA